MATTTTSGGGWRQKSTGFLVSIAAVVLVVVLVGGIGIGYAIEKGRVKTPAKTAAAAKKPGATKKVTVKAIRTAGTLSAVTANSITVTPKKGKKEKITVPKTVIVVKAEAGTTGDLASDQKVLFDGAKLTKASSIIVLPKNARLGLLVSSVDASSMSLKNGTKTVKITIEGATINKVAPAKLADLKNGDKAIVQTVRTKTGALIATEIVILPSNSPFA